MSADASTPDQPTRKRLDLSIAFAICGALFSLLIFLFMLKQERDSAIQQFHTEMGQRISTFEHQLTRSMYSLESLQAFYLVSDKVDVEAFSEVAQRVADGSQALNALIWLEDQSGERLVVPLQTDSSTLQQSAAEMIDQYLNRQDGAKSSTVVVGESAGQHLIVAGNPAYASGQVLALIDLDKLLKLSQLDQSASGVSITVLEEGSGSESRKIVSFNPSAVVADSAYVDRVPLQADSQLTFSVAASESYLKQQQSYMPAMFLLTGLLLSVLFASYLKRMGQHLNNLKQEQEVLTQQLQDTSWSDPLTGVANRIHFDETLDIESRRAVREFMPMSLVLVELDAFAEYRDVYGPEAGNITFCRVTDTLAELASRPGDMIARLDENMLGLVLPSTNELVGTLADRCCKAVRDLDIPNEGAGEDAYLTISAGVVTFQPTSHLNSDLLFKYASEQLEAAKASGGNQYKAFAEDNAEAAISLG